MQNPLPRCVSKTCVWHEGVKITGCGPLEASGKELIFARKELVHRAFRHVRPTAEGLNPDAYA